MNRLFAALVALALSAAPAAAVTLISTANGNIDATGTWSVVDTTGTNAYLNSETANTALTTSGVASSTFTPTASTLTAIGVKLASVAAAPSGTLTVKLANSTSPGTRECTLTVNVADLTAVNGAPTAATLDGGWIILACSASPNGTDAYTITCNTSVAAQVNLFSLATTNWSRLIVTSGTQVNGPAASDKFIVAGKLTGAGTHAAYTVTVETTAGTTFGNVANTLVDPSIAIAQFGTLAFANSAATNYLMQFSGPMVGYNGGTFTIGTAAARIPAGSTATLTMIPTVEGDTGIVGRNGFTLSVAGASGGRNVVKAKLAAQATAAVSSTLTTDVSTGWLSGDQIYVAGTQMTTGTAASYKGEAATLSGNATTTSVPITAAVTNTHSADVISYTSANTGVAYAMNMFADVILLTRNVVVQSNSATLNGYVYLAANSVGAVDWAQFNQISGKIVGQRGLEADTGPAGSLSITNASFVGGHNSMLTMAGSNTSFGGTPSAYVIVQHVVVYNAANNPAPGSSIFAFGMGQPTKNVWIRYDDIAVIASASGGSSFETCYSMQGSQFQFTNVSMSGCGTGAISAMSFVEPYGSNNVIGGGINTWGPINIYSNIGYLFAVGSFGMTGTINGLYIWHENGRFTGWGSGGSVTFDPFYQISSSFGIYLPSGPYMTFRNGIIGFQNGFNTPTAAMTSDSNPSAGLVFENMEMCPTGALGGITWAASSGPCMSPMTDLSGGGNVMPSAVKITLRNSSMLSPTPYPSLGGQESYYSPYGYLTQDCAACLIKHSAWVLGGFLNYDTAITHSSGFSLRMTPRLNNFLGYITAGSGLSTAGNVLTITAGAATGNQLGDHINTAAGGFQQGTLITNSAPPYIVTMPQTVASPGSPAQFLSYNGQFGSTLPRMQSAPYGLGMKVAVASGASTAQACAWIRPSISTDAAPPWGGSAVTYNGDNPRMIVRANPYMGVQSDTTIGTSSPTAGAWSQFCATLPTAPADGQFEVVIDADHTYTSNAGGSVNVAEWSCTNCGSINGSQYWWNGAPADAVTPAAAGGGLLVNPGMHGGMN